VTHVLHYNTHAERRYFLGTDRDHYDLIGLNGNIVSHSPAGVAAFLATAAKPFYIDPQTHAFQHATIHLKRPVSGSGKGSILEFKPSVVRLANERLGEPFATVIREDRPLSPNDFLDSPNSPRKDRIDQICTSVLDFQTHFLSDSIDAEIKEFMDDPKAFLPEFVIAPYFYLPLVSWKEWLAVNIACYIQAKKMPYSLPIYLALVLPHRLLEQADEIFEDIVMSLKSVDGFLLWIDEQEEESLTEKQIKDYISFLKKLNSLSRNVINIHGGYLSTLLCHHEAGPLLSGVGHSANYGEHREVVPIGGGIPRARFYLMKAHSRLRYSEAAEIVVPKKWLISDAAYRNNVCDCKQCNELIRKLGDAESAFNAYGASKVTVVPSRGSILRFEYPTPEAKEAGIRHYLCNKFEEISRLDRIPLTILVKSLEDAYKEISEVTNGEYVSHLEIWKRALLAAFF
jgi:hypothetical protein